MPTQPPTIPEPSFRTRTRLLLSPDPFPIVHSIVISRILSLSKPVHVSMFRSCVSCAILCFLCYPVFPVLSCVSCAILCFLCYPVFPVLSCVSLPVHIALLFSVPRF